MRRITMQDLQNKVDYLNELTSNPAQLYTKKEDGHFTANVGCYHIAQAYGGYQLEQMANENGAVNVPLPTGFVSKRELYNAIAYFIKGIESKERTI